jgi:hypothetical protein
MFSVRLWARYAVQSNYLQNFLMMMICLQIAMMIRHGEHLNDDCRPFEFFFS